MTTSKKQPSAPLCPVHAVADNEGLKQTLGVQNVLDLKCASGTIQVWDCGNGNFFISNVEKEFHMNRFNDSLSGKLGRKAKVNSVKRLEPFPGTHSVFSPVEIGLDKPQRLVPYQSTF